MGDRKHRHIAVREEVRHALVALLAAEPEGLHAYELERRLRVHSEGFWTPYSGELSRMLHQLETETIISSLWRMEHGRARRLYSAAQSGVEHVDAWLAAHITAHPHPLHDKWWHRFVAHRARRRGPRELLRDIRIRRAVTLEQVRCLEDRLVETVGAQLYTAVARMALRIRQIEWQGELSILDEIERELAHEGVTEATEHVDVPTSGDAAKTDSNTRMKKPSEARTRAAPRRDRPSQPKIGRVIA